MWILVVLVVASVLVTLTVWGRGLGSRDAVDEQRQHLDALRAAVSAADPSAGPPSGPTARPSPPGLALPPRRASPRLTPRTVAVAVGSAVILLAVVALLIARGASNDATDTGAARRAARAHRAAASTTSTSTTTTTAPPTVAVVGAQGSTITVSVPAGAYQVQLRARDACWMRAARPDGSVVDTTTLQSGETRTIPGLGPLTLRLGNPGGVDLAIDGHALALPIQGGSAVDVALTPPGSPTSG